MEVGLHFLQDTFGVKPHVYWPLDVMGHTSYMPALLNQYGFDVCFLANIGSKQMNDNFIWKGHSNSSVFVQVLPEDTYSFPYSLFSNT
jgi:lysosomal alpha-mannosidase